MDSSAGLPGHGWPEPVRHPRAQGHALADDLHGDDFHRLNPTQHTPEGAGIVMRDLGIQQTKGGKQPGRRQRKA